MPKATKKKAAKEADFKKAKLKLGKGKKPANNATDTSFKARSIALPGQNPLNRALASQAGSSTEPTTSHGLNLEDIFIRFRHPNAGVRKEALGGLKEILQAGPEREVGKVLKALGGLIADDDLAVRKALLGFLGWYFPLVPITTLEPHLPLLLLQTSSALSHIFPETRLDAARLVNLLLEHIPDYVVGSWPSSSSGGGGGGTGGSTILEGLRLSLGLGDAASASRLTPGGKLVILMALLGFVQTALGGSTSSADGRPRLPENLFDGWDEAAPRTSTAKMRTIDVTATETWTMGDVEGWVVRAGDWAVDSTVDQTWELGRISGDVQMEQEDAHTASLTQLFDQLKSLLLNTFLESAPSAFSISQSVPTPTEDTSLQLCRVSASLVEFLVAPILSSPSPSGGVHQGASDFLKRMAAWFPFPSPPSPSTDISPGLSLSISYAHLATLLSSSPTPLVLPRRLRREVGWRDRVKATEAAWTAMRKTGGVAKGKGRSKGGADEWALGGVAEWIVDLLAPAKDALQAPLSPSTYAAILPVVFALITQPPSTPSESQGDVPATVFVGVLKHLERQSSTSSTRGIGEEFLMRIIPIHEQRFPRLPFYILPNSAARPLIRSWLEGLPKTLWEIGARDPEASERILRFILWLGQRGDKSFEQPYSLVSPSVFPLIVGKLAPFFHLAHPSRGDVPGPWTRLESKPIRKLALDVARVYLEWDTSGALAAAVDKAVTENVMWRKMWAALI